MNDYYADDMNDPEREIIRPKELKKSASFTYCKWAAGDWEARFYAWTPAHDAERERTIRDMVNNPAWFKTKRKAIDKRIAASNNKARGGRGKRAA